MTTNGILLDKYMDFLVKNTFSLAVSLDGNQENNGYRLFKNYKPSFDTVVRNIIKLTFHPKLKLLDKNEIGDYLNTVSLYLNNDCSLNCQSCHTAYKQFPYCTKKGASKKEISLESIEQILAEIVNSSTYRINILGGNVLNFSQLNPLASILNESQFEIHYYINYLNFRERKEWLKILGDRDDYSNILDILVPLPINNTAFAGCMEIVQRCGADATLHFLVEKEADLDVIDELIARYRLKEVELHPYYNGENIQFFKDTIFIDRESVIDAGLSMREIFARETINTLNFKHITILHNGTIYANVNHPRLGRLTEDRIFALIMKEMSCGKSWNKVRKNIRPCKSCAFNALCPPISNYEYTMKRYALCSLGGEK